MPGETPDPPDQQSDVQPKRDGAVPVAVATCPSSTGEFPIDPKSSTAYATWTPQAAPTEAPVPSDFATWTPPADPADSSTVLIDPAGDGGELATRAQPGARPARRRFPQIPGFEIEDELGRGGMGVVYKAREVLLNRPVALKMILASDYSGHEDAIRFLAEAEAVAKLQHPNIVQIYQLAQHAENPFFAMEFLAGGSLAAQLRGTPRTPSEAVRLIHDVSCAMIEAHRQGIVHRDLKPANILLTTSGTPKIADFGLAKSLNVDSGLTGTNMILGTPSYMAPEQAEGAARGVGPPADIYALGAILYELLTGHPPFRGTTALATLHMVRMAEPIAPSRLVPGIPRDLDTIVLTCLQKEPGKRYATAAALADDLARFEAGKPILARPVGVLERGWRWCRRNPALAASLGATALALVAVAAISTAYAANRVEAVRESNLRLSDLEYERAQDACEEGDLGQGLLRFVESWKLARAAGGRGIAREHAARASLSAWRLRHPELRAVYTLGGEVLPCLSPDGRTVFTGGSNRTARFWDAETSRPLGEPIAIPSPITRAAYRPDGKLVVVGCEDGQARFLEPESGRVRDEVLVQGREAVWDVAFSPDGKAIATAGQDGSARLWDASTYAPIGRPLEHRLPVTSVAISPDGKRLLTGCEDGVGRLWNASTGGAISAPSFAHGAPIWGAAFSPDSRVLVTCGFDKKARFWDASTGRPLGQPITHTAWVTRVAFREDGKVLATGGFDDRARLWDATTHRPTGATFSHQGTLWHVQFSPDGKSLLTGSKDGTARLWAASSSGREKSRALLPAMSSHSLDAAFSQDGRLVVAGYEDGARLWDMATGELREAVLRHEGGPVNRVAISPDGKTVATGSIDGTARLWASETGRPIGPPLKHPGWVSAVEFSPDGRSILTGCFDGSARLWDIASGKPAGGPLDNGSPIYTVGLSPDGKTILTGGLDMSARLWDAATGRARGGSLDHRDVVFDSAFSPDGKVVATASLDKTVRFWDLGTGLEAGPRLALRAPVLSVAFSPDGRRLITSSAEGKVTLWDRATGEPFGPSLVDSPGEADESVERPVSGVVFSPDGKTVLLGVENSLRLLELPPLVLDDVEHVATWVEAITGLRLDTAGDVQVLDHSEWTRRRERVERRGGTPPSAIPETQDP